MRRAARAVRSSSGENALAVERKASNRPKLRTEKTDVKCRSLIVLLVVRVRFNESSVAACFNKNVLYHISRTGGRFFLGYSPSLVRRVLSFSWVHPVLFEFPVGAFSCSCLFAHCFAANTVLTGFTDAAFKKSYLFPTNHASSFFVNHSRIFYAKMSICQAL